jgi:carboxypeptidase T
MPYLNVDEVESALAAFVAPPNDSFTQLITLPNPTWEGRVCHAVRIAGGAAASPRVGIYLLGGVHAREWGSPDILISFIERLATAYRTDAGITLGGKSFTAAQLQAIVGTKELYVFPQANPDGRQHSMTADPNWRMNRRPAPAHAPTCVGVDINRNYDFLWHFPEYFSPEAPVANSLDPCSPDQTYIGPSAMSELETRNVLWMLDTYQHIRNFIDLHSYGEKILYSWGDDESQSGMPDMNFRNSLYNTKRGIIGDADYKEFLATEDRAALIDLAEAMRAAIAAVRGRDYGAEPAVGLYPTAGAGDDYTFSRHFADPSKGKVYAFTIEWGREDNPTPFHPPYAEMEHIIDEITAALFEFCWRVA